MNYLDLATELNFNNICRKLGQSLLMVTSRKQAGMLLKGLGQGGATRWGCLFPLAWNKRRILNSKAAKRDGCTKADHEGSHLSLLQLNSASWPLGQRWRMTAWRPTVLLCNFQSPGTEIQQNLLASNFLQNHSKSWTACASNKSCKTHLLLP